VEQSLHVSIKTALQAKLLQRLQQKRSLMDAQIVQQQPSLQEEQNLNVPIKSALQAKLLQRLEQQLQLTDAKIV